MERPGISLAELSEETGLHANTLRDHVRVLIAEGIIRSETERPAHPRTPAGRVLPRARDDRQRDGAAPRRPSEAPRRPATPHHGIRSARAR
ncbi:winged helix-turn-helix domain-containing protein [Microbacterium aurum]